MLAKLGKKTHFSWPDVLDTEEKKDMVSELKLFPFITGSGCSPSEGEDDNRVLALPKDSTGQLGGEMMRETALVGWEGTATWQP